MDLYTFKNEVEPVVSYLVSPSMTDLEQRELVGWRPQNKMDPNPPFGVLEAPSRTVVALAAAQGVRVKG